MAEQYLSVEEFNELIQQWNGKTVKISKQELEDNDTIVMALDSISYSNHTRRIDDYVPEHELQFNGYGKVSTDGSGFEPLPSSTYEIPLEDSTIYQYNDSQITLITNRGTYIIELV